MRQVLLSLLIIGLLIGAAAAQYPYGPSHTGQLPMAPVPEMGPSAPTALIPPAENFRHGWRQTWTHEFRPFQGHEVVHPQQPTSWYPTHGHQQHWCPSRHQHQGGWWWNPHTGCWQRTVTPATTRPTYHYVQPW